MMKRLFAPALVLILAISLFAAFAAPVAGTWGVYRARESGYVVPQEGSGNIEIYLANYGENAEPVYVELLDVYVVDANGNLTPSYYWDYIRATPEAPEQNIDNRVLRAYYLVPVEVVGSPQGTLPEGTDTYISISGTQGYVPAKTITFTVHASKYAPPGNYRLAVAFRSVLIGSPEDGGMGVIKEPVMKPEFTVTGVAPPGPPTEEVFPWWVIAVVAAVLGSLVAYLWWRRKKVHRKPEKAPRKLREQRGVDQEKVK